MSQTGRLDTFIARRREVARFYDEALADLPLTRPWQDPDTQSSWHLYVVRLALDRIKKSQCKILEELRKVGIGVNLHYIPVHVQPYYRNLGFKPDDFPEAERYYQEAVTLPLFPRLTREELNLVVSQLGKAVLN